MEAVVFIKHPNQEEYQNIGVKNFLTLPRQDEYVGIKQGTHYQYFQVSAIHHNVEKSEIELYAIQSEAPWLYKKSKNIGFSFT